MENETVPNIMNEAGDVLSTEEIVYASALCCLALLGSVGNIFILVIFNDKSLSGLSYSIYMRAAAISDTFVLLMNIAEDVIDHLTSLRVRTVFGSSVNVCLLWYIVMEMFKSSSPWVVVALAVDRCTAVWKPLHKSLFCTKRVAWIVTIFIVCVSLTYSLALYIPNTSLEDIDGEISCEFHMSESTWIIHGMIMKHALPCFTMLIPNVLVMIKIHQSLSFRRTMSSSKDRNQRIARSNRPLIIVSCLAFLTLMPISITQIVEASKLGVNGKEQMREALSKNNSNHNLLNQYNRNISKDGNFNTTPGIFNNIDMEDGVENLVKDYQMDIDDSGRSGNTIDVEDNKNQDDLEEEKNIIDKIWKTCNFIYMINFAQNFYILVSTSQTYRDLVRKLFKCKVLKEESYVTETQLDTFTTE